MKNRILATVLLTAMAAISLPFWTLSHAGKTNRQDVAVKVFNDATVLYTVADGQLSVLIPHRFDPDTGEVTDGEIRILKDMQSPPKIKNFPTNSIRRLNLNWRVDWVDEATIQRGAHLYINPNDPELAARGLSAKDLSFELAEAYRRRQAIFGPGQ
jgi:hypothetical protein